MRTHLNREEIQTLQQARRRHLEVLTERAHQGDFGAFVQRQHFLSRDPIDIGIEWDQFQKEEK